MPTQSGRTAHIAWYAHGESPEILLLHGFSDSAACWDPLISFFTGRGGVLATDAAGHGNSGLPTEPVADLSKTQAADMAAVLDDVDTGPVVVIGHSMGASTAAMLAHDRPDLVRALVLEDPPTGENAARHRPGVPDSFRELVALDLPARIAQGRLDNPTWPDDELPGWAVSKGQLNPRLFDRVGRVPHLLTDVLADVRCPILLVHGDPDRGGLISAEFAAECADKAAGPVTVVHIDGVGHSIRREARDRYLTSVGEFLGQIRQ